MELSEELKIKLKPLLLNEFPNYIFQKFQSSSFCMSYSWLISHILDFIAIKSKIKCIAMFLGNSLAMQIIYGEGFETLIRKITLDKLNKKGTIWTIGVGFTADNNDFHTIVQFKDKSILDGTILQASRPQYGLNIENFWDFRENFPSYIYRMEKYSTNFPRELGLLYNYQIREDKEVFAGYLATFPEYSAIIHLFCERIEQVLNITIFNKEEKILRVLDQAKLSNQGKRFVCSYAKPPKTP